MNPTNSFSHSTYYEGITITNGVLNITRTKAIDSHRSLVDCPLKDITFVALLPGSRLMIQVLQTKKTSSRTVRTSTLRKYLIDADLDVLNQIASLITQATGLSAAGFDEKSRQERFAREQEAQRQADEARWNSRYASKALNW